MRRQILDLLDVKDGVPLHERNIAFGFFAALLVDFRAGDGVGFNDKRALLTITDRGVQFLGLPEGHPNRGAATLLHRGRPKHQNNDAAVGLPVMPQRLADRPCRMGRIPRLHPRPDVLVQFRYNLPGDPFENIASHCSFPLAFGLQQRTALLLQTGYARANVRG